MDIYIITISLDAGKKNTIVSPHPCDVDADGNNHSLIIWALGPGLETATFPKLNAPKPGFKWRGARPSYVTGENIDHKEKHVSILNHHSGPSSAKPLYYSVSIDDSTINDIKVRITASTTEFLPAVASDGSLVIETPPVIINRIIKNL